MNELTICHDCYAEPGKPHTGNCDVEMCSVCGSQYNECKCEGHDRAFARWTGFMPGSIEAMALGISMNKFLSHKSGMRKIFFIKPKL